MEGQTFRIFLTLYVGNMILVESLKAIKVAARKAQMSFKITTFTANVDSNQIFRTFNLVFLLFKLGLECRELEVSNASLSIDCIFES